MGLGLRRPGQVQQRHAGLEVGLAGREIALRRPVEFAQRRLVVAGHSKEPAARNKQARIVRIKGCAIGYGKPYRPANPKENIVALNYRLVLRKF